MLLCLPPRALSNNSSLGGRRIASFPVCVYLPVSDTARRVLVDVEEALTRVFERSTVTIHSNSTLAGEVGKKVAKIDADRQKAKQTLIDRKQQLIPVSRDEHDGAMKITPWELLHTLGRATVLSGQGSSRALAQHWSCLKYITTLQKNYYGRMELSADGHDPRYHRKSVQAEDLGIAFALSAALRIAQRRHPDFKFEIVDADVALEAGWALRGAEVRSREKTLLRPDYFLVGLRGDEPARLITVECKGSHGRVDAQYVQLAKASAQVHAVVVGGVESDDMPPPSLLMATALRGEGGIEMRILDPEGDGVLAIPGDRALTLNGPTEQLNELAGIPSTTIDGRDDARPGFYVAPDRAEWFSRVLARTSAAGLLAFVGDRAAARALLTNRQQDRVGPAYTLPGTGATFDTGITLGGLFFVGTDHVFRFGPQRLEAFSGLLVGLHQRLAAADLDGYQALLPDVLAEWEHRRERATQEWGGVITMDINGAVLGLRPINAGQPLQQYSGPR